MTTENLDTTENTDALTEVNDVVEAAPVQETDPVAALTADLQRLQAEYANYRKRVERDRAVAHELAIGSVLTELLATLDDIDRQLIGLLRDNARLSVVALAKELRMARATVQNRLARLERDRVARPYLGEHDADHYVPFLWTMFLFILCSDVIPNLHRNYRAEKILQSDDIHPIFKLNLLIIEPVCISHFVWHGHLGRESQIGRAHV